MRLRGWWPLRSDRVGVGALAEDVALARPMIGAVCLGGRLKSGHLWTVQNRPFRQAVETREFYRTGSSVRKSVWTFVRQLRGPHFSTCA